MADLGLTYSVRSRLQVAPITSVLTYDQGYPIGSETAQQQQAAVAQRLRERLGWFSSSYGRYVRMPPLRISKPGDDTPVTMLQSAWVQSLDGIELHAHATAGTLPQA